jgi:5'(3')-deoxyribonucleotidase
MRSTLRVFLDLDDVIVAWSEACLKLHKINLDNPKVIELIKSAWNMGNILGSNFWETIENVPCGEESWWEQLPMLPWGISLYNSLRTKYDVCFLTDPANRPAAAAGKIKWINRHFGKALYFIGSPKDMCANDNCALIDDKPFNCEKFRANGGHAFLWPNALVIKNAQYMTFVNSCMEWLEQVSSHQPIKDD